MVGTTRSRVSYFMNKFRSLAFWTTTASYGCTVPSSRPSCTTRFPFCFIRFNPSSSLQAFSMTGGRVTLQAVSNFDQAVPPEKPRVPPPPVRTTASIY